MAPIFARFACAALLVFLLAVGPARGGDREERAPSDPCGRTASLQAARDALARGDRAAALEHLRKANALLDACARQPEATTPEQVHENEEPALAFGATACFTPVPS